VLKWRVPKVTKRVEHLYTHYIDYAVAEAHTSFGRIGVKVWICRGEIFGKRDLSPNQGVKDNKKGGNDRNDRNDRNERGGNDKPRFGGKKRPNTKREDK
jgi:small subunit ribosomal protein S3